MHVFLLILRIVLIIAFITGIIMSFISGNVARAKKFPKESQTSYYQARFKVIGYLVSGIALAVLILIGLF